MSVASEIYSYASQWNQGCSHGIGCRECEDAFVQAVERVLDRRDLRATLLQQRESAFGAAVVGLTLETLDMIGKYPAQADAILTAVKKLADECALEKHLATVDAIIQATSR